MAANFIPDNQFQPDQEATDTPPARAPAASDQDQPQFIPDEKFQSDEDKFGTPSEQAKAGLEAVARGATLGLSDETERMLGIAKPEDVRARREANPVTAFVGETVGSTLPLALTEGATGAAALGPIARGAIGGATLGAGNVVSDLALGEPNLNAQKILADIGGGIVAGAGFGALEKGIAAVPAIWRGVAKEAPAAAEEAASALTSSGAKPVSSIEEAAQRLETARKYGALNTDRPQASELSDALTRVDLGEWAPPEPQLNGVANPEVPSEWNLAREMSGKVGETVRGIEAAQKQSAERQLDQTIEALSPESKPTADAAEGGKRATQAFTEQYQGEKESLKPVFDALKTTTTGDNVDHLPGIVDAATRAVPGTARMFDTDAGGFALRPYQSNWGIARSTYNAVREAVEAVKDTPTTSIEELMNIRSGLKQHENVLEQGQGPAQLRALGAGMMDYIQKTLDTQGYALEARSILKDWAVNEQERELIEKTFGSAVGNPQFGAKAMKGLANESIGDKIFANTANVRAAKQILGPEKFKEVLANWLSEYRAKATDKGAFSSNKFSTFLRSNQDALREAMADNPALQRIHDLTTVMRILPDAPSINPSGSAKTLMAMAKHALSSDSLYGVAKNLVTGSKELVDRKLVEMRLNDELAGRAAHSAQLKSLQGMATRVGTQITQGAKAVWGSELPKALAIESGEKLSDAAFDEQVDRIKELSANPQSMASHLSTSTVALSQAAPNITQGLQSTIARGVQFLATKVPGGQSPMLLSQKYEPPEAEKRQFGRYLNAVNHPLSIFAQVKRAQLTPEAMEAIAAVHPDLLQEFRKEVMTHFTAEKAKSLSFAQKTALSQFLGQPLTENMTSEVTAQNQAVFASPNRSQQSISKPGRSTLGGMKQLDASGRASTKIQEGKDEQ